MYGCMYGWMDVTRPFPLAGYCSETAGAAVTKFCQVIGRVQPFVVLKFRARATGGVPSARANVRHWFNIGRPPLPEMRVHRQQWAQNSHLKNWVGLGWAGHSPLSFHSKNNFTFFRKSRLIDSRLSPEPQVPAFGKQFVVAFFYIGSKQIRMPSWCDQGVVMWYSVVWSGHFYSQTVKYTIRCTCNHIDHFK